MKYLFFLLLLGNIVFYLWETGIGRPHEEDRQPKAPPAAERLVLLKELPQPPAQAPAETQLPPPQSAEASASPPPAQATEPPTQTQATAEPQPAPPPAQAAAAPVAAETAEAANPADSNPDNPATTPPKTEASTPAEQVEACRQLGPYASARQAQAALDTLGNSQGRVVKKPTEVENGYLILYPPADSLEAAQANRKMLVEKGFKDAWVMEQGENRHAISLAVVHNKGRAEEAARRYQAQGMAVLLKPRISMADRWWLEVRGPADPAAEAALAGQVTSKACD